MNKDNPYDQEVKSIVSKVLHICDTSPLSAGDVMWYVATYGMAYCLTKWGHTDETLENLEDQAKQFKKCFVIVPRATEKENENE